MKSLRPCCPGGWNISELGEPREKEYQVTPLVQKESCALNDLGPGSTGSQSTWVGTLTRRMQFLFTLCIIAVVPPPDPHYWETSPTWFFLHRLHQLVPQASLRDGALSRFQTDLQTRTGWATECGYSVTMSANPCYIQLLLFCHPVVSDSLQPHGLQHTRPPCRSPSPKFAQVHVYCISDAIQPSHPLMPSSPSAASNRHFLIKTFQLCTSPALNLSTCSFQPDV